MENINITLFVIQIIIILILFLIIVNLLKLSKVLKYEKRITRFTIAPNRKRELSFFDRIELLYYDLRKRISVHLKKLKFFDKYSLKYQKYVDKSKKNEEAMDYISTKVIFSFLFLIIVLISDVFWYKNIGIYQVIYSLLIGFFVPDILLISVNRMRKREIEADLLKAITIMNNAFKSGNSIMQAIEIASNEIDGPIKNEFNKMYIDMTYGLSLETVFDRFSKRVDLDEAKYMTTSLAILNKTGGNIAKVFSSIEKSFFSRRKLQQEMKALTSTAEFMFRVLVFIPIAIFGIIIIINPTYFQPLFSTALGTMLLLLMIVIYIVYIVIVRRIMKVEGV